MYNILSRFGYLWAVHSLFYWWRDQGLAEQGSFQSEHSPCYLNRMDPTEVAVGWGKYTLEVLRAFINRSARSFSTFLEVVFLCCYTLHRLSKIGCVKSNMFTLCLQLIFCSLCLYQ